MEYTSTFIYDKDAFRKLIEAVGKESAKEIIEVWAQDTQERFPLVYDAVSHFNQEIIQAEMHRIRGAAANLSARKLPAMTEEISRRAKENNYENLNDMVAEMEVLFFETKKQLLKECQSRY